MEDIELLLDRFLDFKNNGQSKYFDADDIISLIDYFTETDDLENLQIAIDLGYELHPDNMEFKFQICKTLASLGDYETAIKMLEENEVEGDRETDLLYIECLCELDLKDDAINFIAGLAEEESPYLEEAIEHMACVLNDIDESILFAYRFILDYMQVYPDNKILKTELCFNLELQGRIKEAMTKCNELLQSNLYSVELWFMKGRLYATCCDYGNAVEAFDYALSCIETGNEEMKYEILMLKANCFQKNENYYSAVSVYEEMMAMEDVDIPEIVSHLSECLIKVDDYEEAYQILKGNLESEDFDVMATNIGHFIFCCVMTNRRNEAIDALCDVIASLPRDIIIENLTSIIALQSDLNNIVREDGDEDRQELVKSFINSNLHVN
jgi:tetratricopeptide (TPR) repeat protein